MKTEMVNALNSSIIGGNLVQMDNKNRYHVTDKNGKRKVLSQDQFKRNLENNYDKIQAGQEFTFKKSMSPTKKTILTLAGIGAAIAAVIYRKDILKIFNKSKIKEKLDDIASSQSGQKVQKAIEEQITVIKEAVNSPQKTGDKIGEMARDATVYVTTKALEAWVKLSKFIQGFKK